MIESSNVPETFFEYAKSVMTFRNGKVIEQTSKTNRTDPKPLTKPESSKNNKDLKVEDKPTILKPPYLPKVPFSDILKVPIFAKKEGRRNQ